MLSSVSQWSSLSPVGMPSYCCSSSDFLQSHYTDHHRAVGRSFGPIRESRRSHPSQRSESCSTIIGEREVSWSRQHLSRTGPSRWRGCNHRSHDNLQQDLAGRRMANTMDPVVSHHTSQERQPAAVPELPNNKPHQSSKQSHAFTRYISTKVSGLGSWCFEPSQPQSSTKERHQLNVINSATKRAQNVASN